MDRLAHRAVSADPRVGPPVAADGARVDGAYVRWPPLLEGATVVCVVSSRSGVDDDGAGVGAGLEVVGADLRRIGESLRGIPDVGAVGVDAGDLALRAAGNL